MDHKNIDKLFEKGLGGFRKQAPSDAWNRLHHDLNLVQRKKSLVILRWAAASLLILIAFGAGYYYATYFAQGPVLSESDSATTPDMVASPAESGNTPEKQTSVSSEDLESIPEKNISAKAVAKDPIILTQQVTSVVNGPSMEPHLPGQQDPALSYRKDIASFQEMSLIPVREIAVVKQNFWQPSESKTTVTDPAPDNFPVITTIHSEDYYTPPADSRTLKWTIGAQFAPTYSYREISTNYNAGQNSDYVDDLNNAEEALLSYAGGVNIAYAFNSKWSLNSGMYYSRIGQVNSDALEFRQEKDEYILYAINTSTGIIDIAFDRVPDDVRKITAPKDTIDFLNTGNIKVIQNFDLFEIPFMVKYHLLNKKLSINVAGGLSPAYLVKNNTYLEYESNKYEIGDAANLNDLLINSSIGLGIGYKISKKLTFSLEPTFKYSLSPINNDSKVYYHPYYLSWFTGINYKF
ncbi:MAG: PorT family protein [Bacteroidetes bacterium]|nr:PorT family protein [Bacteroidota bacterium]